MQKLTLKACDPCGGVVTLWQLAASILGPDAEVGTVVAAAKLGEDTVGGGSMGTRLGTKKTKTMKRCHWTVQTARTMALRAMTNDEIIEMKS